MKRNKNYPVIFGVILLLIVAGFVFLLYRGSSQNPLEKHTCFFDKDSLDLKCSSELRIRLGYETFLTKESIEIGNDTFAQDYDVPIYSENSMSNLNEIYKTQYNHFITDIWGQRYKQCANCDVPQDKKAVDYFKEYTLYTYRKIEVLDVKSNETFRFYVSKTGTYDVTQDNTLELSIDVCKENKNTICMPDQHWRCWNYDTTSKTCDLTINFFKRENKTELCYKLEKEDLIAYCLARLNINKCFEYSESHLDIKKICNTIQCQDENKVEYEPGKFSVTNYCENVYSTT